MALAKFKYTGGSDTGINANKQATLYGIVFPVGKAVEVPDEVAHKMRTKSGREGDEFVEVSEGSAEKTEAEKQRDAEIKAEAKSAKEKEKPPTPDELDNMRKLAEREKARVEQVQADAKRGR